MSFDPEAMAMLGARMAQGTPQAVALRLRLVSVDARGAAMAVPWREDLVGDPETGVMAGGVITTLLDHVCGLSVSCAVIAAGGGFMQFGMATLDLRIDYMRPAEPRREVIALARCYKLTRSIAFVRASAYEDDEANPVATAQAAFAFTGPRTPLEGPGPEAPAPADAA
jgi:uncharacterized protein (TIGR00369 family)